MRRTRTDPTHDGPVTQVAKQAFPSHPHANAPSADPVDQMLLLQRTAGNQALTSIRNAIRTPGRPLDTDTRTRMEAGFNRDLVHVRVHTDGEAAQSAAAIHAHAYTVGQDVVFADGQYAPDTTIGRQLLAHELAHTIRQRDGAGPLPSNDPSGVHESSARIAAHDVAGGQPAQGALPAAAIGVSMAPADERAIAAAEAIAAVEQMDREEKEDEDREKRQDEEGRRKIPGPPTTLSLLRPDPKYEASLISDEDIYLSDQEKRAARAAEAEATIARMDKEEREEAAEEQREEQTQSQQLPGRPTTLSLLHPSFAARQVSDEEIYEPAREPQPEEPHLTGRGRSRTG
jgi:uncharacterized protein DUF4157